MFTPITLKIFDIYSPLEVLDIFLFVFVSFVVIVILAFILNIILDSISKFVNGKFRQWLRKILQKVGFFNSQKYKDAMIRNYYNNHIIKFSNIDNDV